MLAWAKAPPSPEDGCLACSLLSFGSGEEDRSVGFRVLGLEKRERERG